MSIKGNAKEFAGYVKEEAGELLNDKKMMQEGRAKRNEGRIMDGQLPKVKPVGTDN